jgi:hypothetical protein
MGAVVPFPLARRRRLIQRCGVSAVHVAAADILTPLSGREAGAPGHCRMIVPDGE